MTVQLSPEQQRWLEAQVEAGHFASIEQAVALAVADLMAMADDDLEWARPLIEAGLADVERGQVIPGDEAIADLEAMLRKPR
jgi:Arc/MetJ-type ribon-helix-helix transcriptional regulator